MRIKRNPLLETYSIPHDFLSLNNQQKKKALDTFWQDLKYNATINLNAFHMAFDGFINLYKIAD